MLLRYIFFDLEFNQIHEWERRRIEKESGKLVPNFEILQVGMAVCNDYFEEMKSFDSYVLPRFKTEVNKRVSEITGITTEDVVGARRKFDIICDKLDVFFSRLYSTVFVTWGSEDYKVLCENLDAINRKPDWMRTSSFIDLQVVCMNMFNLYEKPSLESVCKRLNIDVDKKLQHSAIYDARLLCMISKSIGLESINEYNKPLKKIPKRVKAYIIDNEKMSKIERARIFCPSCKTQTRRLLMTNIIDFNDSVAIRYLVFCKRCKFIYEYEINKLDNFESKKLIKKYWFREFKELGGYLKYELKYNDDIDNLIKIIKR